MPDQHSPRELANLALVRRVYAEVLGPLDSARVDDFFAAGLKAFLDWAKAASPAARHDVRCLFADGDHVIAHVHVTIEPGTLGNAVVDIFRIEEGRIAEHWDVAQPVAAQARNGNGMF
jgi:predicted SnoaL-like aldol condensation-catalyzing enzyme